MAEPVKIIPCNCGSPVCHRHHISVGNFYQGTGWGKNTAQLIADLLNGRAALLAEALEKDGEIRGS